jgi:flagellin-like protein
MKILRSRKALSPVVASIILIAVTVAVSIAVAAWMGALTFNFMGSSSISVTNTDFLGNSGNATNTIYIHLKNTGTKQVTIANIKVNNLVKTFSSATNATLVAGAISELTIESVQWYNGNPYKIELYDASGGGVGSTQQNAVGS